MFNCCDSLAQLRIQKYYSKERKCQECGKKAFLNPILGLCADCTKKEIEFLYKYINSKIKNEEMIGNKKIFSKQKIKHSKHRKYKLSA